MFTGIVQKIMPVVSVTPKGKCLRVRIKKPVGWKMKQGQSVSVDGICSTVVSSNTFFFDVEYMPETIAKTTVGAWKKGTQVNLERSLTLKDFVDGGIVLGHVDARGRVQKIVGEGETKEIYFSVPMGVLKFIAQKGSVTVNGVNLTVVRVNKNAFSVALIPYTLAHTNLGMVRKGENVNIEIDVVARYVERMLRNK